jgi:ABC-type glycerol-3-phosphate transport system permease component
LAFWWSSSRCSSLFPLKNLVFWMIFITLMLPVEVRIGPTYKVVSTWACSTPTPA